MKKRGWKEQRRRSDSAGELVVKVQEVSLTS